MRSVPAIPDNLKLYQGAWKAGNVGAASSGPQGSPAGPVAALY